MAESINVPIEVKWMKSNLFPEGDEKGFEVPSKTRLQKKVRESGAQPVPVQYAAPISAPVEEMRPVVQARPAPRPVAPPNDEEIPSIHYQSAHSGPSKREQELEAELSRYRAAMQRPRVVREPVPSPEDSEDDSAEEVHENPQPPTKKRPRKKPEEKTNMMTYAKVGVGILVGLLFLGGRGGAGGAAQAKGAVPSVNQWA